MKVIALALFVCASLKFVSGQQQRAPAGADAIKTFDSGSYFMTKSGDRVKCFGLVGIEYDHLSYYTSAKQQKRASYSDISYAVIKSYDGAADLYLPLLFNDSRIVLQRIVAYNDKYLMTDFFYNFYYMAIFDWDYNPVEQKVKQTREKVDEAVQKYFNNCQELLQSIEKNKKGGAALLYGTALVKCGTKDIFETLAIEK